MNTTMRLGIILLIACTLAGCSRADLSDGVSRDAIREIQLGMTPSEVVSILGQPKARQETKAGLTLTFSAPVKMARQYPMLWVHFADQRVVEVYAKLYIMFGVDDQGAYGFSEDGRWEASCFAETFPE